jgi:hypothetical protein
VNWRHAATTSAVRGPLLATIGPAIAEPSANAPTLNPTAVVNT